ncbi:M14 family zinc carboxypeptidase [Fulvivirga lutea]|uniref:Succinylglutamate desuccinylase/aspartoacylase family protein n=1 Tax=Fulvivirga lutea TaxID=2810512 RepID=A0A975A2E5_9BACT|nr:M14 family zinc carboxypeptidase [Fulvivirga lutea]QSE98756.1 succinylglutamate desuccinylase/aspartoacylase family protein [Fulvivirga lutea]
MKLKLIYILILIQLAVVGYSQQPGRLTNKFFPDLDVTFNTPAFESKHGFTNYKELIAFLEELTSSNEHAQLLYLGKTQKGRKIPYVKISKPGSTDKLRIWMQGGIHGNEPASSEGMLAVLSDLLTKDENSFLLDRLEVVIVPMVNIDGYVKQNRRAKNDLDLNRDLMKLQIPEIKQLRATYADYSPHVSIDFHEYNPFRAAFRQFGDMGYTSFYDAMFLYTGELNVEPKIRDLTENLFVKNAKAKFTEEGFQYNDYFSPQENLGKLYFNMGSTSARSSATSFALGNSISVLMEIRGIRLNRNSFERRVYITYTAAFSYLKTAYENHDRVLAGVNEAIESTIAREHDVVIKSKKSNVELPIKFIDIAENEAVENEFPVASSKEMTPVVSRERPYAYVLPSNQTQAIENLRILGLDIDTLKTPQTFEVQSYVVEAQEIEASKYQGYFPNNVSTQISTIEKQFEQGAFIIRLNQKNANLAVTALEPENENSFVRVRVVEAQKGEEIPIYRLMNVDESQNF